MVCAEPNGAPRACKLQTTVVFPSINNVAPGAREQRGASLGAPYGFPLDQQRRPWSSRAPGREPGGPLWFALHRMGPPGYTSWGQLWLSPRSTTSPLELASTGARAWGPPMVCAEPNGAPRVYKLGTTVAFPLINNVAPGAREHRGASLGAPYGLRCTKWGPQGIQLGDNRGFPLDQQQPSLGRVFFHATNVNYARFLRDTKVGRSVTEEDK
ncbi:hypothetical protein FN846DRAFT_910006 [Sphaerosporella brunnea]|uniref:Uncharacterized protein n=1 Tax=Sphaerosporella brunnea TaxID=1250544 RepID=A0A5J5EP53_9PEZI|nr:hypothetical protein FN846DRAFT_910006 [Sphaerosporella brunnea]